MDDPDVEIKPKKQLVKTYLSSNICQKTCITGVNVSVACLFEKMNLNGISLETVKRWEKSKAGR